MSRDERNRQGSPSAPAVGGTRREFLRHVAAAAAGLVVAKTFLGRAADILARADAAPAAAGSAAPAPGLTSAGPAAAANIAKSRVIVITHPEALLKHYEANRPILEKMIERAVRELTGADSEQKAWRQVAAAGDRVSMKLTRAGGDELCTHAEIPAYLAKRLAAAGGVDAAKIRAWDRPDLTPAEMELSEPYRLPSRGRDTKLRAALVKDTTAILNLPVLKMHTGTGVSISLKNHFGSINNPSVFHGWDTGEMWKSIAELNNLEPFRKRTRLIVCDATRPLFQGGPNDVPEFRWNFNGLIVGTDPVAVDAVGLGILEKKREEFKNGPWPATDGRKVVDWAQKIGVGNADATRLDVVTIKLD